MVGLLFTVLTDQVFQGFNTNFHRAEDVVGLLLV